MFFWFVLATVDCSQDTSIELTLTLQRSCFAVSTALACGS